MADINVPKSYWNGELIGTPNIVYDEFVNYDVVKLPYADRKSNSGYAMAKRKGYVLDRLSFELGVDKWYTRDVVRENVSNCVDEEYRWYFYQVSANGVKYRVITKLEGDPCSLTIIDEGNRCSCNYERFIKFQFAKGEPRLIDGSNTDSVAAASETWGTRIYDNSLVFGPDGVKIGDYVLIHGSSNSSSESLIGQLRQVIGFGTVDPSNDSSGYNYYIELDPAFSNWDVNNTIVTGIEYSIYPEYGYTYGYINQTGIRTIDIDYSIGDIGYGLSGESCVISAQEFNGRINYLNDKGFNFFGGQGLDALSFNSDSVNFFGANYISTLAYRNFLLGFSYDEMSYVVESEGTQFIFKLSDSVGIKSKYAAAIYKNGLLMVSRDNRLLNVGLSGNSDRLYLDTEDVSDYIRGYLDNMLDDDEVFIDSWNNKLYIFINTRTYHDNGRVNMTKILILDEDYKIWYTHELCDMVISGVNNGYFYGDGFYGYMGEDDVVIVDGFLTPRPIKTRVSFYIGDQQNNGLQDSEGNTYRLNRRKSLHRLKFTLGAGIYTDGNTIIKVDTYRDGYKYEKIFDTVEGVEWIDNWNNYFAGDTIAPSRCFTDDLDKCDNVSRPCEGAYYNDTDPIEESDPLICVDTLDLKFPVKINEYCICHDSRAYALSPFYNVFLYPLTKPGDLHKITMYTQGYDRPTIIGIVAEFTSEDIDSAVEGKNVIGLSCKKQDQTCPVDSC